MFSCKLDNIPKKRDKVVSKDLMGEMVFLDLDSGYYYSSNKIGSMIWEFCDGQLNVEDIILKISEACGVEKAEIEPDIFLFIDDMLKENLLILE